MIGIIYSGISEPIISDELWQYDYGQKVQISGLANIGDSVKVHFSTQKTGGIAPEVQAVVENGVITARIPDELLENNDTTKNYKLYVFVYPLGETSGETAVRICLTVFARPKPEYYEVPAEELQPFDQIVAQVGASAVAAAASATSAAEAATAAAESASSMSESVTAAAESASAAATSASEANVSAENAARAAQAAAESAEGIGTAVEAAEAAAAEAVENATTASEKAAEAAQSATEATDAAAEIESTRELLVEAFPVESASGEIITVTDAVNLPVENLSVSLSPIQEGTGDPSPVNIRPITGRTAVTVWRGAVYDPSADPALTIQLGQIVYSATVDVTGSKAHVTHELVDMSAIPWSPYANSHPNVGSAYCYFENTSYMLPEIDDTAVVSNLFINRGRTTTRDTLYTFGFVQPHPYIWLRLYDGEYHTRAEWQAKLAGMGAKVILPLAVPFDIDLTPEEITMLAGVNNIWSNGDSVQLDYRSANRILTDADKEDIAELVFDMIPDADTTGY